MRKFLYITAALITIQTLTGNGYGTVELTEEFIDAIPQTTLEEVKEKIERKVSNLYTGTFEEWIILSDTEGCRELINEGCYPIPNYQKISNKKVTVSQEIILEKGLLLWGPVGKKVETIDLKNLIIQCQQDA